MYLNQPFQFINEKFYDHFRKQSVYDLTNIIAYQIFNPVLCKVDFIKKISAGVLLAIYLIAATATTELLKLPFLIAHFYHHKTENIQIGLVSFLKMHYEAGKDSNKDAKENNHLPFKSAHHSVCISFISLVPSIFAALLTKRAIIKNKPFEIPNHLQLPSKYLVLIWQPPRSC